MNTVIDYLKHALVDELFSSEQLNRNGCRIFPTSITIWRINLRQTLDTGRKGLTNQYLRQYNSRLVMDWLYRQKQLTKAELAQRTELSIAAISNILEQLGARGLVAATSSTTVPHRTQYGVAASRPYTLCLNVSPTTIGSLLVDHQIEFCSDYAIHHIAPDSPAQLLDMIIDVLRQKVPSRIWPNYRIAMAVHGQVDVNVGASMHMPQAPWQQQIELKYLLEQRLGVEVLVDNDCVMMALAEQWLGDHGQHDFCTLNIDYGIGSSFVINQRIYRGDLFGSGQIGHSRVVEQGLLCGCGRRGCLETEASSVALCRKYLAKTGRLDALSSFSFDDFVKRYQAGEHCAVTVADDVAHIVGQSLYNLLVTLNINNIVIYGNTCQLGRRWLDIISAQALNNPFADVNEQNHGRAQISYGSLSQAELLSAIAYLWVDKDLGSVELC